MKIDYTRYIKQLGLDPEKILTLLSRFKGKQDDSLDAATTTTKSTAKESLLSVLERVATSGPESSSSISRILMGSPGEFGDYYFPSDVIGGSCPHVVGEEEEIVWNSAAEACDTERVHLIWQVSEGKVWYLSVRSSELASHPGSWCPFGALLPGMKDATPAPVCYTYYSEDTATMMAITSDRLQIFRGTTLVVRAKAERTAREIGNAPIIELVPDAIMKLSPVPWYSASLFEDRARRILATMAIMGSVGLMIVSLAVWLIASMTLLTAKHNLSETLERTKGKTTEMMRTVEHLRSSPMREQLATFAELNDGLLNVNGFLEVYQISGGKTRWRAVVPNNVTADRINELGGRNIESVATGMAIGNAAQIEYESSTTGKQQ